VLVQALARLRQPDGAPRAVDQGEAELLLERRDVVGHDRLRIAERERRLGERAPLGDGVEGAEAAEIVHRWIRY
jgi:hypothetical protein